MNKKSQKPSENMIGVTSLEMLEEREKQLKKSVKNMNIIESIKCNKIANPQIISRLVHDKDCLKHMKLREDKQIKHIKYKISKLMMENEQADKVKMDAKIAEFKQNAMAKTNQTVFWHTL